MIKQLLKFIFFVSPILFAQIDEMAKPLINKESLEKHVLILASDSLEGRAAGTKGELLAADYISSFYKSIGIKPYKDSTYYQEFGLGSRRFDSVEFSIEQNRYKFGKDYYSYPKFKNTNINSKNLIFLGYGIESETYNDYDKNVEGKIVVVLNGEPKRKDGMFLISGTTKKSPNSHYKEKRKTAKKHGALAILIIKKDKEIINDISRLEHYIEDPGVFLLEKEAEIPFFYINEKMCKQLIREDISKIENKIQKREKKYSKEISERVKITVTHKEDYLTGKNVLGYIEGQDPKLKEELIVITAHYDHIGIIDGLIHNGADDNASGTAIVLEVAKTFQEALRRGYKFKRSILCMPVSAEENGLLGSYYYAENPVYPLENTITNLNIDMIGRMDEDHRGNENYIYLIGTDRLSVDLHNTSEKANSKYVNMELDYRYNAHDDPNRFYYRSDHYNFAKNNIPSIFYFSGIHEDYHKHTDTPEKLSYKKIERLAELVFFTAWELSNAKEKPQLNK